MPKEDLAPYAGLWVALRNGYVVASATDASLLCQRNNVQHGDTLMPVPRPGLLICSAV